MHRGQDEEKVHLPGRIQSRDFGNRQRRNSAKIYEALAAFEQRRLSDLEPGSEDNRALEDAERGLLALKAARIDPSGTQ
jgi:hypothetical protein